MVDRLVCRGGNNGAQASVEDQSGAVSFEVEAGKIRRIAVRLGAERLPKPA